MVHFTPKCLEPPHKVTRPEQVDELVESMLKYGWKGPPLVGYRLDGKVQLLTGTHRRAAAERINFAIPVVLRSWEEVKDAWGDLDKWQFIMNVGADNA